MIDYEKLKLAHELAYALSKDTGNRCDIKVSIYFGDKPIFGYCHYGSEPNFYESMSIDDLIAKLQELTQPKPKYEIGQEVWFILDRNIHYQKIDDISKNKYGEWTYESNCLHLNEERLYPSRESLIDAQIEYWNSLKKCQHESNGKMYGAMEWGAAGQLKCKKCGEFYS